VQRRWFEKFADEHNERPARGSSRRPAFPTGELGAINGLTLCVRRGIPLVSQARSRENGA
jgi:hypothetical protein